MLNSEVCSAGQARFLIAESMPELSAETLEIVLLLTSELVTNAVIHGASPVGLHGASDHQGVRVEVKDQSPELPVLQAPDRAAPSGRGLLLVDSLAKGWGVLPDKTGKCVWFTL